MLSLTPPTRCVLLINNCWCCRCYTAALHYNNNKTALARVHVKDAAVCVLLYYLINTIFLMKKAAFLFSEYDGCEKQVDAFFRTTCGG
jgi:hypothetical protein